MRNFVYDTNVRIFMTILLYKYFFVYAGVVMIYVLNHNRSGL